MLAVYLNQYPDSATALNLRACNHFRLYNGKAAEVSPTTCYWDICTHNKIIAHCWQIYLFSELDANADLGAGYFRMEEVLNMCISIHNQSDFFVSVN